MTDGAHVVIIAEWEDEAATSIRIQNVEKDGRSFIPVFTSRSMFEAATKDGPFADRGVSIDVEMLLSMMNGDEELVLNPGSAGHGE